MNSGAWLLILLGFGLIVLVSYLVRLQRQSKQIEKQLDYSKMRKWEDEE